MKKLWIAGILFLLAVMGIVSALPTGPEGTLTPISSSRYSTAAGKTLGAIAGNVTELNLNATSVTQTWQGYFGNITGRIVLGDSSNNTMYDWNLASPQGEIYATRKVTVPVWSSIQCAGLTEVDAEDTALGTTGAAADSVNKTFSNATSFTTFYVGSVTIDQGAQDCYATHLYNNTGVQSTNFAQVLLYDGADVVYTALLDQDAMGFDGRTHDFQMIVGEDGHNGDTSTTPYYFYLELE